MRLTDLLLLALLGLAIVGAADPAEASHLIDAITASLLRLITWLR